MDALRHEQALQLGKAAARGELERQADEDVAAGRVTRYDNADGFLTSLETL